MASRRLLSAASVQAREMASTSPRGITRGGSTREGEIPTPFLKSVDRSVFTFTITRATAAVLSNVPVPLFAPSAGANGYVNFVAPFLDNGISISGHNGLFFSENAAAHLSGNATFDFTDGVGTDRCTISCVNTPYKMLQQALLTDGLKPYEMKVSVPTANTSQFSQPIHIVNSSPFGNVNFDSIVPGNHLDPYQDQANQIVIGKDTVLGVDLPALNRQRGLAVVMEQTVGLVVTISLSIEGRFLQAR